MMSVSVNNSRSEGSIGGGKVGKAIIKELKELKGHFSDMAKSSKLKDIFGAGLLTRILGTVEAMGAGILMMGGAAAGAGLATPSSSRSQVGYAKVNVEGESQYAEIDNRTGKILDILTEQEAIDNNILDEKGNIRAYIDDTGVHWKKATEGMESYKDQVLLSVTELKTLYSLEADQRELQKDINRALRKKLNRLTGSSGEYNDVGVGTVSPVGVSDAVIGAEFSTIPSLDMNPYDQWWKTSPVSYVSSIYKSP